MEFFNQFLKKKCNDSKLGGVRFLCRTVQYSFNRTGLA
jgi:hypothetical protein